MKKLVLIPTAILFHIHAISQPPKTISDCTVNYSVSSPGSPNKNEFSGAEKTVYIRGREIRTDINSNHINQTIFYNSNTGQATVLKEVGQSKYISHFSAAEWEKENEMYKVTGFSLTGATSRILNYECKEAILQLKNGKTYTIYYTPDIIPSITENPFEFRDVPGFVLKYETTMRDNKLQYTATKISFDPVPAYQFEIPKTGYRILQ
jgi:GLPGLI family protein